MFKSCPKVYLLLFIKLKHTYKYFVIERVFDEMVSKTRQHEPTYPEMLRRDNTRKFAIGSLMTAGSYVVANGLNNLIDHTTISAASPFSVNFTVGVTDFVVRSACIIAFFKGSGDVIQYGMELLNDKLMRESKEIVTKQNTGQKLSLRNLAYKEMIDWVS